MNLNKWKKRLTGAKNTLTETVTETVETGKKKFEESGAKDKLIEAGKKIRETDPKEVYDETVKKVSEVDLQDAFDRAKTKVKQIATEKTPQERFEDLKAKVQELDPKQTIIELRDITTGMTRDDVVAVLKDTYEDMDAKEAKYLAICILTPGPGSLVYAAYRLKKFQEKQDAANQNKTPEENAPKKPSNNGPKPS